MGNEIALLDKKFERLTLIAKNAAACGLYAKNGGESAIFMTILAADEMGIGPMEALNGGLWNIQGKIEISARLMSKMIRKHGHSFTIKSLTEKGCIIEGKRADNGDMHTAKFDEDDARKAGLLARATWKSYPEDMYYARALSRLGRRLFADVIGNAYIEGEIRDALPEEYEVYDAPKQLEAPEMPGLDEAKETHDLIVRLQNEFPLDKDALHLFMDKCCKKQNKSLLDILKFYNDRDQFKHDFDLYLDHIKKQKEKEAKRAAAVDEFERIYQES